MSEKLLFWLEELGREHIDLVGKKCANLGEMTKMGLPVPRGFSLSVKAHERFLKETNADREIRQFLARLGGRVSGLKEYEDASRGLRQIVEAKEIPGDIRANIEASYDRLCERCGSEIAVSVRSAGTVSHPGQYETYLNVKGCDEVLNKVVKVWSSIYNVRTIAALDRKGLAVQESPPIGVAVLELVNARCAGVGFTCHPESGDSSFIVIEGNWGLGESVVSGALTPDKYIVDKRNLKVLDKRMGDKTTLVVASERGAVERETSPEQQCTYCLADSEVLRIAELARTLEEHFGAPQDIEWAISNDSLFPDNIFLLQTRPVAGLKSQTQLSSTTRVIDQVLRATLDL
jgi:pyruvate,water dikinase